MALEAKNSQKSRNTSLFKLIPFILLAYHFNHPVIYVFVFIWLLFNSKRQLLKGSLILFIVLVCNHKKYDFMPCGMIEDIRNNSCIVNKLFYKSLLIGNEELNVGDIIITFDTNEIIETSHRSKLILFQSNRYEKLGSFVLKNYFYRKLQDHPKEMQQILDHTLNNRYYQEDISYDLGYGLFGYYFFKRFSKKAPFKCLFCFLLYNLLFVSQIKYLLIIIDIIAEHYKLDRYNRYALKLLFIAIIDFNLFRNYAILIPLLLEVYQLIDFPYGFTNHLAFIESVLFCRIDLFSIFFFRYLLFFRSLLFLISLLSLIFPFMDNILMILVKGYSFLNSLHLDIRGKLNLLAFLLILSVWHLFKIEKHPLKLLTTFLILFLPLSDPLLHISFIDIGQGDSSLISYPFSRDCVLIDTGSPYNYYKLQKYLFAEGIYRIEYLIITHDDSDHNGNIENLQNDFHISNIITEGETFQYRNIFYNYLSLGEHDNDNDNSLVYLLDVNGLKILFTGDISSNAEKELLTSYGELDVDILKVAHHGSKSSSSDFFISHTLPEYAMISTSGMYYHPHYQVLNTLKRYDCRYFVTKDVGTIKVYLTRIGDFIKTDKNEFVIMR